MLPVAASELAGIYGAKPATIEVALGDPETHAVVIATSTDTHADLIQGPPVQVRQFFVKNRWISHWSGHALR